MRGLIAAYIFSKTNLFNDNNTKLLSITFEVSFNGPLNNDLARFIYFIYDYFAK